MTHDFAQLLSGMLLPCSVVAFESALAQGLEQPYPRVFKVQTGQFIYRLTGTQVLTALHRFLIWIGSDQEKTFGPTITGLIKKHIEPERMILWDSKQRGGRPDTVQLLKDVWKSWNAEGNSVRLNFLPLWTDECPGSDFHYLKLSREH
jgi:hypothetical protein